MADRDVLRQRLEETRAALAKRVGFEEVFTSISTALINLPSDRVEEGINQELGRIGRFLAVDRVYVFLFNGEGTDRKSVV